jgi:hypothetical protein
MALKTIGALRVVMTLKKKDDCYDILIHYNAIDSNHSVGGSVLFSSSAG